MFYHKVLTNSYEDLPKHSFLYFQQNWGKRESIFSETDGDWKFPIITQFVSSNPHIHGQTRADATLILLFLQTLHLYIIGHCSFPQEVDCCM